MKLRTEVQVKDWVTEATLREQNGPVAFLLDAYSFLSSAALHTATPDSDGGFQNVATCFNSSLQF